MPGWSTKSLSSTWLRVKGRKNRKKERKKERKKRKEKKRKKGGRKEGRKKIGKAPRFLHGV